MSIFESMKEDQTFASIYEYEDLLRAIEEATRALFSYDAMGRVVAMWQCGPSICGTSSQASRGLSFAYDWTSFTPLRAEAAFRELPLSFKEFRAIDNNTPPYMGGSPINGSLERRP